MEAEYITLSLAMRALIPMRQTIKEVMGALLPDDSDPQCIAHSTVFEDNDAARTLANLPHMTPRSKHIAVKYHFFRSKVQAGELLIARIDSKLQKADIFTKGLDPEQFETIRKLLMGW